MRSRTSKNIFEMVCKAANPLEQSKSPSLPNLPTLEYPRRQASSRCQRKKKLMTAGSGLLDRSHSSSWKIPGIAQIGSARNLNKARTVSPCLFGNRLRRNRWSYRFTCRRLFCVCRSRSNTSAKSSPPALSRLPFRPSTPHHRLAREHIRPAWGQPVSLLPA